MSAHRNARAAAARVVVEVIQARRSLARVLREVLPRLSNQGDRALVQEISYGVLRWEPRLRAVLGRLLLRAVSSKDQDIHALAMVGLYQLLYTRVPAHAAVSETVAATRALGKPWAAGLINAVLRRFERARPDLLEEVDSRPEARLAHPSWLLAAIREAWPEQWEAVLTAANGRPPLVLRLNPQRTDRARYCGLLEKQRIVGCRPLPHAPQAVLLAQALDVERIPGFSEGMVSVQDGAAQLASGLLELGPGQRVLDACAAPGGKTAQMLELEPRLSVTALDIDAERLGQVDENLLRLKLRAQLVVGDALYPRAWWDGSLFDRILVDAPCSATGVIRRHPDIKVLRTPEDVSALAQLQGRMLEALWPLLAPGGMLLYATCSVLPKENSLRVADFLAAHEDAVAYPIEVGWGRACGDGRQILPGEEEGMDGFYYARLVKRSPPG